MAFFHTSVYTGAISKSGGSTKMPGRDTITFMRVRIFAVWLLV